MGYSPWGHRGSDTTERPHTHTHTHYTVGTSPQQCLFLSQPRLHTRPQGGQSREVPAHGLWEMEAPGGCLRVSG